MLGLNWQIFAKFSPNDPSGAVDDVAEMHLVHLVRNLGRSLCSSQEAERPAAAALGVVSPSFQGLLPALFGNGSAGAGKGASGPARSTGTLHLRCAPSCWLDVRAMDFGNQVAHQMPKGDLSLPIGAGLGVFSGRADLLMVRLNHGPDQPFSTPGMVGRRRFLPAAK
jgi:hypothetical protein